MPLNASARRLSAAVPGTIAKLIRETATPIADIKQADIGSLLERMGESCWERRLVELRSSTACAPA
jgi:hypothetical protein